MPQTPQGWYPDPEAPERERYWDGHAWSEQRRASAPPPAPAAAVPAGPATLAQNWQGIAAIALALVSIAVNPLMLMTVAACLFGARGIANAVVNRRLGRGTAGLTLAIAGIAFALALGLGSAVLRASIF